MTGWLSNVTAYNYDLAGDLIKTNYPDGSTINYQFDNGGRLTNITDLRIDGSLNAFYKYTLDQLGNRTGISFSQPLNMKAGPQDTSYTHDVDNRLLTAGSISFGYDDNGNLITKTIGSNVTNYSWDFNNMLTQVTKDGNTYTYRYDVLGKRVAKVVNSVETRYVGSLAETDASGDITAYYVYGLGLISKIIPSNQSYFYHFDGLGSTIAITDSSGNAVNKYAYDEHGNVLNQDEAISNPFKYVGHFGVMDEGNGLLYMRARYYDPEVGRFISKDPIGFAGGLNLYAYVQNNPVNRIDPLGLYFGQMPPPPPGYNPATWKFNQWDSGNWVLHSPDGRVYTAHTEDEGHWRHWGIRGPDNKDEGDWPSNPGKRKDGQTKLKPHQCDVDPSGDAPGWMPPIVFFFFWPSFGIPAMGFQPGPVFSPVFGF